MTVKEQTEAKAALLAPPFNLKLEDTIYLILRSVSANGMRREITPLLLRPNDADETRVLYLGGLVAKLLGLPNGKGAGSVKIRGTGMDMGFALVYDLTLTLWPKDSSDRPESFAVLRHEWL